MRQVVAGIVSPLPNFDIIAVPALAEPDEEGGSSAPRDGSGGGHGFYLIAVPPSPTRPRAVHVNEALRYPKRNGATTRYLSEPEVAAAYRDRPRVWNDRLTAWTP